MWDNNATQVLAIKREREPEGVHGEWEWAVQGYEIEGEVEPIPEKMKKALEADCPIYPGKKGKETWKVVYKPKTINGQPTTINYLGTLLGAILSPPHETGHRYIRDQIQQQLGDKPVEKGEWLMILTYGDGLVPGSRGESYLVVGGFTPGGLVVDYNDFNDVDLGVGVLRAFD